MAEFFRSSNNLKQNLSNFGANTIVCRQRRHSAFLDFLHCIFSIALCVDLD